MVVAMSGPPPLFDAERMRVYPRIFLTLYALFGCAALLSLLNIVHLWGEPNAQDFLTFYAASKLTLAGDPASAFNNETLLAMERSVLPIKGFLQWGYPPTFQLLIAPLALLPYSVSFVLFVTLSIVALALALGLNPETKPYRLVVLAAPATALCAFTGQNSLLTAALFAGGMALSRKRPLIAGTVLGLLAFKPQMGLLLPIALLAAGQWRVFAGAALGAIAFAGLATAMFGLSQWQAFFEHLSFIEQAMRAGELHWSKIPSAFVFARMLDVPEPLALALQLATALAATAGVALAWRRIGMKPLAWATLMTGTLLVMPYTFDYELAILGVPLALLADDMSRRGAVLMEKLTILLVYALSMPVLLIADATHLQIGFILLVAVFALCLRRALATRYAQLHAQALPA